VGYVPLLRSTTGHHSRTRSTHTSNKLQKKPRSAGHVSRSGRFAVHEGLVRYLVLSMKEVSTSLPIVEDEEDDFTLHMHIQR